jgi:hypothetical protein
MCYYVIEDWIVGWHCYKFSFLLLSIFKKKSLSLKQALLPKHSILVLMSYLVIQACVLYALDN